MAGVGASKYALWVLLTRMLDTDTETPPHGKASPCGRGMPRGGKWEFWD